MNTTDHSVLEFKSGFIYALRLLLKSNDMAQIFVALEHKFEQTGSLFKDESVIIDAHQIEGPLDWQDLINFLTKKSLQVIGVSAQGELLVQAKNLGLHTIDIDNLPNRRAPEPTSSVEPVNLEKTKSTATTPTETAEVDLEHVNPTMILTRQLRSGQRVYAKNADLIVIGAVSRGAEIIADGNIHVYGPLRGRAIAGARGNTAALIFTSHLDAELVAIAGIYRLIDADFSPETLKQPAIIELDHDTLIFHNRNEFN